jgi:hypothetical protein
MDKDFSILDFQGSGKFYIELSNIRKFDNGTGYIEYSARDFITKSYWKLREYFNSGDNLRPLSNKTMYSIIGVLRRTVYKDKTTKQWVDKGAYLEFKRKDNKLNPVDIEFLKKIREEEGVLK